VGALQRSRPLLKTIGIVAAAGIAAGVIAGWILAQFVHLPQVDQLATFRPATTTEIIGPGGETLASYATEQRIELSADQIPDHLKLAIVAIEDAEFFEHGGVDPKAIARAAAVTLRNLVTGRDRLITQGGSTLTQQLALNLFLKRETTLQRKIKEALLAIDIEKRYTKDQILTLYANQVFFGHGAYGVEAAARLYFDKPALALTLPEAAMIAGIIPSANNRYNPYTKPEAVLQRRNHVLDRMLELGFIERAQHDAAIAAPLGVGFHREYISNGAHFLEMVRKQIEELYGTSELYTGGLRVSVTMDPRLQAIAERVVRRGLVKLEMQRLGFRRPPNVLDDGTATSPDEYQDPSWNHLELEPGGMVRAVVEQVSADRAALRFSDHAAALSLAGAEWTRTGSLSRILRPGDLVLVGLPDELPAVAGEPIPVELLQEPKVEGALIAIDNSTGAILALVGGFDFERSEFNRAVQSTLQCGSAFKPFVYLTAFEQGFTPADTIFDAPFLLPDSTGKLNYCPRNYYNKYYGVTTLRRALEHSYNASAVKLQQLVGGDAVVDMAKRFGIGTELHPFPSLALGAMEVRLVDLVRAYAGIANLGEVPEPYAITAVHDRDGRPVERFFPRSRRAISAPAAYLALSVLEGVIDRGTGESARSIEANLAGKTGTTDRYTDAWFVGFTPRITVGVWVGRDVKAPIGRRMTGAIAAQPIWNEFITAYLETVDESARTEAFSIPSGIVFSPVDYLTGESALPPCPYHSQVVLEAFLDTTEPAQRPCGARPANLSELPWPFQVAFYTPRQGEPMPTAAAVEVANRRATSGDDEEAGD
jgi:penicillin-binding protein 1A